MELAPRFMQNRYHRLNAKCNLLHTVYVPDLKMLCDLVNWNFACVKSHHVGGRVAHLLTNHCGRDSCKFPIGDGIRDGMRAFPLSASRHCLQNLDSSATAPYALKAPDADTIRGLPPSAFVLASTFG